MEINSAQKSRIVARRFVKQPSSSPSDETPRPPLAEAQRWLRWIFTEPRGIQTALETPHLEPQPRLLQMLVDAPPLALDQRLGIYSDAYFLRLLECLEADFPATQRALGKEKFRLLAADYLQKHPSTSANVSDLGESLPSFVQLHASAREFPFLYDLVKLEWEVLRTLYSTRLPPLDVSHLQKISQQDWPKARLILDPSVVLLQTSWPVDQLWERRRKPEKKSGDHLSTQKSRLLLVYRDDAWVQVRVIDPPRWFTLTGLQEGVLLGPLCEKLAAEFPDQAEALSIMEWFKHWIRAGVIKRIEI